uniref:G-protein coupled receptors family 1 profile domain-containing protein n=1 Tax=Magallana gigas TaxID=29159 RepID=K1Q9W6_MAGGI
MTSNWLTALLGVQRLVAIALPFKHTILFNSRASCVQIAVIVAVSVLLNLYEALGIYISELPIYETWYYNETLPSSCTRDFSQGLVSAFGDPAKSNTLFFIFSGLLYRLLPVLILIVTTVMLVYFLYKRQKMRTSDTQRKKQIQRMTILIFLILVVFLIAEIQDGITYFIYAAELSQDKKRQILSKEDDIMRDTISSMLSLISYAYNFWIFFLMKTDSNLKETECVSVRETMNKKKYDMVLRPCDERLSSICQKKYGVGIFFGVVFAIVILLSIFGFLRKGGGVCIRNYIQTLRDLTRCNEDQTAPPSNRWTLQFLVMMDFARLGECVSLLFIILYPKYHHTYEWNSKVTVLTTCF